MFIFIFDFSFFTEAILNLGFGCRWHHVGHCSTPTTSGNVPALGIIPGNLRVAATGTSVEFLTKRLHDIGRQDLLDAVGRGELSTYAAAEAAGLITRPALVGGGSPNASKRRKFALRKSGLMSGTVRGGDLDTCGLTFGQLQELWLGCGESGSLFSGEEELRAAWDRARGVVMRIWANNGRRPQAWWYFDAPGLGLTWPGYDRQQSYLFARNVLSETERTELLRFWRREFERAQTADFTMNTGAEVLHGIRARRAHYAWADIPRELIEAWTNGRRRREGAPSEEAAATK